MDKIDSLSTASRSLTYLAAILFGLLGLVMFIAPAWGAANFAWKVSPFVTMTMGGWCLGTAVVAWESARIWRWAVVHAGLVYLWAFGLAETAVLAAFRDKLLLGGALAAPYILALAVTSLMAVVGLADWVRRWPSLHPQGVAVTPRVRFGIVLFALGVAYLCAGGLLAGPDSPATQGAVFPEPRTLFTVRAFAVFFGAVALASATLIPAQGMDPVMFFGRTGLTLIVPILIAAFLNMDKFDLAARPGGLIYLGVYIGCLLVTGSVLIYYRGREAQAQQATA